MDRFSGAQPEALLEKLNLQLNREVTTFLRYMTQAAMIRGEKHERVREMYHAEVTDELGHAQYLADQIVTLGGKPWLEPDLTPPEDTVSKMLEHDANEERIDVHNYIELAEMAGAEGFMSLKLQMEEQVADEERHGQTMYRFLGKNWD